MGHRRHYRSHWKELLASEAARKKQIELAKKEEPKQEGSLFDSAAIFLSRYRHWWLVAILPILAICPLALASHSGGPKRVLVSGRVLIDGRPLTVGVVTFIPDTGRGSTGTLDEEGCFTLTCLDGGDGAVPGMHRIEVSLDRSPDDLKQKPWPVPRRYASAETSGLTAEITERTDELTIKLTTGR